jgi:hypothetical protein
MGRTAINVMLANVNEANVHTLDPASERRARSETSAEPLIHRPFGKDCVSDRKLRRRHRRGAATPPSTF